jgi:ectoine hydroxylase-related dioxygenase (phytanoyl-CoA dioxygenase family)
VKSYEEDGYLVIKNMLPEHIKTNLAKLSTQLEELPETPGKWMKYYEVDKRTGNRMLCRIENFLPFSPDLSEISYGLITDISTDLFGEQAVIYKEKINFKFPKGSGFNAHQDQPAFVTFGIDKLLTVLLPIDPNTRISGGLDMVRKLHKDRKIYSQNSDGAIRTDIEAKMNWIPVDGDAGDLVFFDSFAPHRSDINFSTFTRRNLYLTYNPLSVGSFREMYYEEKRRLFPPECERDPNKDYSEGAKVFNVANPIK